MPAFLVMSFNEQSDAEQEFYAWRYQQCRKLDPLTRDTAKDWHQRKAQDARHLMVFGRKTMARNGKFQKSLISRLQPSQSAFQETGTKDEKEGVQTLLLEVGKEGQVNCGPRRR